MYLSFFLPPFPPPLRPFSYFIFLYLFSMCLCLTLSGFPANGSLSACNGSPNCHALLFPLYSLGRHSAKSSISPTVTTLFPLFPFFFFFSLFFKQLNWIMFALRILRCAFFTLVSSLLRLIAGLYNTCFSRAPQRLSILNSLWSYAIMSCTLVWCLHCATAVKLSICWYCIVGPLLLDLPI